MDLNLAEAMKNIVAKGIQTDVNASLSGPNYISEKLYLLLQLYLKNKGWNPSIELLQCFTELQESSMLPSASYLQYVFEFVKVVTDLSICCYKTLALQDAGFKGSIRFTREIDITRNW